MTAGNVHDASTERHGANDSPYTAQVGVDPELNSTVISLLYEDRENPSKSITVGLAPDLGSNMFRFRVGEHDIIYAMFDLREPVPIANLKLDHIYTGLHKNGTAVIEYRKQAMRLRITASEAFTHVVIYTPPSEADGPFFCLENQTCSTDAINLHSRDLAEMAHLLELRPGEGSDGFIQYTVSDTYS